MGEKIWTGARNALFSGGIGLTLGGILGPIAGGIIGAALTGGAGAVPGAIIGEKLGTFLGGIFGVAKGTKDSLSQIQEKDRAIAKREVSRVINLFIEDSQRISQQTLSKAVKDLERSMRDEFTNQIKRKQKGCKRTLISLQESRKLTQAEAAKRSKELQIPLQQLTQLQNNIAQIAQVIVEQPVTVTSPPVEPPKAQTKAQTQAPSKQKVTVATDTNADYGDWADE